MDTEILKVVAPVAGIGGLALLVFYYLLKDIISKNIFTNLSDQQSYSFLRWILFAIWSVVVLGILAWVYAGQKPDTNGGSKPASTTNTTSGTPAPYGNPVQGPVEKFGKPPGPIPNVQQTGPTPPQYDPKGSKGFPGQQPPPPVYDSNNPKSLPPPLPSPS